MQESRIPKVEGKSKEKHHISRNMQKPDCLLWCLEKAHIYNQYIYGIYIWISIGTSHPNLEDEEEDSLYGK